MEQELNEKKENKIRPIVWSVLLAIFVLGQVASMYIPAFSGSAPSQSSMVASPIWFGLWFVALGSIKSKSKIGSFILGAVVGFIVYFGAGFTYGYKGAENRAIEEAVKLSNENLPKMIDEETRMDSASIDIPKKEYYINITLVNFLPDELELSTLDELFETTIKPGTCGNQSFLVFFNEGYSIFFKYHYKDGSLVKAYKVSTHDCK